VSRDVLREIASQFQNWAGNRSQKWGGPILEATEDRRDKFLDPDFRKVKPNQVVAMVKGREPARILIAIGNKKENRGHLQSAPRCVVQYNSYINEQLYKRATRRPDVRPRVSVFAVLRPRLPQLTSLAGGAQAR